MMVVRLTSTNGSKKMILQLLDCLLTIVVKRQSRSHQIIFSQW